jgi:hypothetical protein
MNSDFQLIIDILPWLIPLFILEIALLVIALVDLVRREHVTGGNKIVWILVIVLINLIGPIVYFIFGRKERPLDGD